MPTPAGGVLCVLTVHLLDVAGNLYINWAQWYDPCGGSFVREDCFGFAAEHMNLCLDLASNWWNNMHADFRPPIARVRVKRRKLFWFSTAAIGIGLVSITVWALCQYPRYVLLYDVQHSNKIIVAWRLLEKDNTYSFHAFELDESNRKEFVRTLTENLGLDYLRGPSMVVPTIGVCLVNDSGEVVTRYGIRRSFTPGRSPAMESLRDIASKGRRLSEDERSVIFTDKVPSNFPHILPWPDCRYAYILPTVAGR